MVIETFERQQARVCLTISKEYFTLAFSPVLCAKDQDNILCAIIAWIFVIPLLCGTIPVALILLIIFAPVSYCAKKSEGRKIIRRLKIANGEEIQKCGCCCCFEWKL